MYNLRLYPLVVKIIFCLQNSVVVAIGRLLRPSKTGRKKSERLLRGWHLDLTADERRAIIWHMGAYANDAREHFSTTYRPVASASLLVKIIHEADHHAAKKSK